MDRVTAEGMLRLLRLQEAIASVSLSHPEDCNCLTCRAGRGDKEAFVQIARDLEGSL